jgi:hypothetical protein
LPKTPLGTEAGCACAGATKVKDIIAAIYMIMFLMLKC